MLATLPPPSFTLKDPMEKYEGIAKLLKDREERLELFTSEYARRSCSTSSTNTAQHKTTHQKIH